VDSIESKRAKFMFPTYNLFAKSIVGDSKFRKFRRVAEGIAKPPTKEKFVELMKKLSMEFCEVYLLDKSASPITWDDREPRRKHDIQIYIYIYIYMVIGDYCLP